jgi:predicted acetyltransferase
MTVTVREARNSAADCQWIRAVYPQYISELSNGGSGRFPALGEWDDRQDEFLASWFNDNTTYPFVILTSGERTGFALVSRPGRLQRQPADFRMSEFFVQLPSRRRGVGASAAWLLFQRFGGEWEVVEDEHNRAALAFWRRVIGRLTNNQYRESSFAGEVRHRFRVVGRAPTPSP